MNRFNTLILFTIAINIILKCQSAPVDDSKAKIQLETAKRNFVDRSEQDLVKLREQLAIYRKNSETHLRHEYSANIKEPIVPIKTSSSSDITLESPSIAELNADLSDYLYQGDVMLTDAQLDYLLKQQSTRSKRQAYVDSNFPRTLWTSPISYYFDAAIPNNVRDVIREAIKFWEDNTCVKFNEGGTSNPRMQFILGSGCWSYIGRVFTSNNQQVSIGSGCEYLGIVAHEIAHALGYFHTQSRYDRDGFVTINLANVQSGYAHNFDKETPQTNNNYGYEYDLGSVMHYAAEDFAINTNIPVINSSDARYLRTMGNRREPSFIDVQMMNRHYSCLNVCNDQSTACNNGGYMDPKNCAICKCPDGFSGASCTDRQPASNGTDTCGASLTATSDAQIILARVGNDQQTLAPQFTTCYWHIDAPENCKIETTILFAGRVCSSGCFYGGIEFKSNANFRLTGIRHCCNNEAQGRVLTSETNKFIVSAFSRYYWAEFQISYRSICSGQK